MSGASVVREEAFGMVHVGKKNVTGAKAVEECRRDWDRSTRRGNHLQFVTKYE